MSSKENKVTASGSQLITSGEPTVSSSRERIYYSIDGLIALAASPKVTCPEFLNKINLMYVAAFSIVI
jgi:hypothetical protein